MAQYDDARRWAQKLAEDYKNWNSGMQNATALFDAAEAAHNEIHTLENRREQLQARIQDREVTLATAEEAARVARNTAKLANEEMARVEQALASKSSLLKKYLTVEELDAAIVEKEALLTSLTADLDALKTRLVS